MRKIDTLLTITLGLTVCGAAVVSGTHTAHAEDAAALWDKKCASCHGKDGKAATKMGKKLSVQDLTDPGVRAKFDKERMFKAVKEGIKAEGEDKFAMKAYAETFTDEQIKALIDHAMSFGSAEPEAPPETPSP